MRRGIKKKFIYALTLFSGLLTVCLCLVMGNYLRQYTIEKYEYIGTAMTQTIANDVNGDKIAEYLETGEPDEYYDEVLHDINEMNRNFGNLYTYVAIPEEDHVLYIWSNDFTGDETIGFTTEYSPGGEEWMKGRFKGEEEDVLRVVKDPKFGDIATAGTPIYNSAGEPVALALADFSVNEINQNLFQIVLRLIIYMAIIVTAFILIFYRYVQVKLVEPIEKLTDATKNITEQIENNEETDLNINTGDEVEILADSFQKMGVELKEYISDNMRITAEKERIGTELSMATRIQESSLPREFPPFPDRTEFDIFASMDPAKEVGGDFYDFFMIDDDHLGLVIADVSGKGVPAALFMMICKLIIQNVALSGKSPAEILTESNEIICRNNQEMMFVTVWVGVLEISTGKLTAANAGHEYPALKEPGKGFELLEDKHGVIIGGVEGAKYGQYELTLLPDTKLFVYTDGVPESIDDDSDQFGTDRMIDALNSDPDAIPEQILINVRKSVDDFVKDAGQFDDLTMLCLHYKGPKEKDQE